MEMMLNLPNNYVEIDEEEMIYLDGGVYTGIAIGTSVVANAIELAVGYVAGKAIASLKVASKLASLFGYTTSQMKTALSAAGILYTVVYGNIGSLVANALDSNKNGWIGLHYKQGINGILLYTM